ncbi:MAG: beta strand repeat-containing protein, partial [Pseudolabrys sp.]
KGAITVTAAAGIHAQTGTGILNGVGGIISVNNSGAVSALGSAIGPVIEINNGSTHSATFTNTGTVTANLLAETGSSVAVAGYNGSITVNNSGTISGNAQLATATFNNNAGGVWNVRGSNSFGSGANAINNAGIINIAGASSFSAAGSLAFNNSGTVNVKPNSSANIRGAVTGSGTFSIGDRSQLELESSVAAGQVSFASGNGLLTLDSPSTFNATIAGLAVGDIINLLGFAVSSASISGSNLDVTEVGGPTLTYHVTGTFTNTAFNLLSGNQITLVPTSAMSLGSSTTTVSETPSTSQFYVLSSNASISAAAGAGLNVASQDTTAGDISAVEIDQGSTVSAPGTAVNLTATAANIELINAGTISSSGGIGVNVNAPTGSADVIDFGNVTANQIGIDVHTSGLGLLNIVVGGGAMITGTNSYGILAIATVGSLDVATLAGTTINAGSAGILAENQGTSVPLANNSSISVSTQGTINSGSTSLGSGNAPAGIVAGYLGGASSPASPPNPNVFGNVSVQNSASINAAAGSGINAFNYGVGDVSVSDGGGAIITATQAGATAPGFTQYGISAFNYGSGKTTVTTDPGATINSGGTGINAGNQATAIAASAASTVSVVSFGTINSGANLDNSGSTPAGILAGFNPNNAGLFNAAVAGDVLIVDSGTITAAAGDGVRGYNYGVGNIEIDSAANITALVASTSTGRETPYGIGAFNYGPGNVVVTTGSALGSGSVIHSGGSGVEANNQDISIASAANSIIAITTAGSITSGTILNNNGSQPGGIQVGYFGAGAANTNVNGTVIVNNTANISAAGGYGIDAYNYGNGNVTVDDGGGTTVSGAQYGIAGYAESGGTGNLAINVSSNASITGTSTNGILAFSTDAGNISVITNATDVITSGSTGINVVNEAAAIAAAVGSSITVTAYGTINSGTALTGTSSPPGGITAGYLGGSTIPTVFPLTGLNGDVVVNNFATINAAGGDGIRAYNFGIGDITVNDEAGSITLGGADPVNGYDVGISAVNEGTGSVDVTTAAGILIDSRNGSAGIVAANKAPAPSPGSAVLIPSTSHISVLAYGTIESGTGLTGSGDPPAGIIASYNPNSSDTPNSNVQGSVSVDDYASILAPTGTDGIRGVNYGTGTISILAEVGAVITAGRYGIAALGHDGGDVTVTNYATVTGGTAAIDATSTLTGAAVVDNYGAITGDVLAANAAFDNEAGAVWNLAGSSVFATGTNVLINAGTIDTTGTSSITSGGSLSVTNTGTVNVQSGSLDIAANVAGTGAFTIANGATLEIGGSAGAGETVTFLGATGTLTLDHSEASPFAGQIADLTGTSSSSHDSIDLVDMASATASAHYVASTTNPTSWVLTVSDGSGHTDTFDLVNYPGSGVFTAPTDGGTGTLVFDPPATAVATDLPAPGVVSTDAQVSS